MRGSGLSLERFIRGKAQKTKSEAKTKKKIRIHKALRRREYAKIKKQTHETDLGHQEDHAQGSDDASQDTSGSNKRPSFYDSFFAKLQQDDDAVTTSNPRKRKRNAHHQDTDGASDHQDEEQQQEEEEEQDHEEVDDQSNRHAKKPWKLTRNATKCAKPDPFFKAKRLAEEQKQHREQMRQTQQRRQQETHDKIQQRKKRHVKLSVRSGKGQPIVRHQISDLLSRLQQDKAQGRL